jgi:hypothetical protein
VVTKVNRCTLVRIRRELVDVERAICVTCTGDAESVEGPVA